MEEEDEEEEDGGGGEDDDASLSSVCPTSELAISSAPHVPSSKSSSLAPCPNFKLGLLGLLGLFIRVIRVIRIIRVIRFWVS